MIDMRTMTANEAKTQFGELLMTAQREPVSITKNGKQAMIAVEPQRYAELEMAEADLLWRKLLPTKELQQQFSAFMDRCIEDAERGNTMEYRGDIDALLDEYEAKIQ